jgi:hypothetical protein
MPTVYRSVNEAKEDSFQLPVAVNAAGTVRETYIYLTAPKLISSDAPSDQKGKIRPAPVQIWSSSPNLTFTGSAVSNYSNTVNTFIVKVTTNFLNPGETAENELVLRYRHWDYRRYWQGDTEYCDEVILDFKLKLKTIAFKCTTSPDFQLAITSEIKKFDFPAYTAKLGDITFLNASSLYGVVPVLVRKYNITSREFSPPLWPYFTYEVNSINLTYRYIPAGYPVPLIHTYNYAEKAFAELQQGVAELKMTVAVSGCLTNKTLSTDVTLQIGQPIQEVFYLRLITAIMPVYTAWLQPPRKVQTLEHRVLLMFDLATIV